MALGLQAAFRTRPSTTPSPLSTRTASTSSPSPSSPPVPSFFLCPITYEIMSDPVTLDTGMTYDRDSIEEWLDTGKQTCPATNRTLHNPHLLIPNVTLRRAIRTWVATHRSVGQDCLDTVSPLLEALIATTTVDDERDAVEAFHSAAKKLYTVAEESGRTRRALKNLGAIEKLTQALVKVEARTTGMTTSGERSSLSSVASNWRKGMEYAVATIAMLHPSGKADKCSLSVPGIVTILSSLLSRGSTTAKINSTKILLALLSPVSPSSHDFQLQVGTHWGALKGLLSLLRDPSLPAKETRLALRCLLALLAPHWNRVAAINERGVHSLVALLPRVDSRSVEDALAILEVLASCAEGREAIAKHPFAIPRIVEYLHGGGGQATESAVGTLHWVMEVGSKRSVVVEAALKAGAFATLLMLLSSECSGRCKEKAREMLKSLNRKYEGRPGDDDFSVFIKRGNNHRQ